MSACRPAPPLGSWPDRQRILHGQCSDRRCGVTGLRQEGFDVRLQAGAATGIMAGQTEDDGS